MGRPIDARNLRLLIMETNFFICNGYCEYTSPISPQLDIITRLVAKAATRAVMIPIFLEPIPESVPQSKWAGTGADSNLESVPVVEPVPVLELVPILERAPKNK